MGSHRRPKFSKTIMAFVLIWLGLSLTACIDLAGTQSLAKNKNYVFNSRAQVYVMRGGLGGIFSTGMNQLQKTLERDYKIKTESTTWFKAYSLADYIVKHYGSKGLSGPIVLVGHSLGANEQIKVARILAKAHIPVAILITVDAVSPLEVSPNVKYVLNIYKPSFVPMFSGLRVRAIDPTRTQVENLNVDTIKEVGVNHFTIDKHEVIQKIMIEKILAAIAANSGKRSR